MEKGCRETVAGDAISEVGHGHPKEVIEEAHG